MPDQASLEQGPLLSTLPAGPRERRLALAAVSVSFAVFVVAVPFARVPLPTLPAFIASYQSALAINDLITAALFFGQFSIGRSPALLLLASGYVFTALIAVSYGLSFPGLFAATGLLGAGPQTTAWLYMFRNGGFPLAVLGYAFLKNHGAVPPLGAARVAILLSVALATVLVVALTVLATIGHSYLPTLMEGNEYTPAMDMVVTFVWSMIFLALLALLVRPPYSILDLWLMVVLCVWLCDTALSAVFNAGLFDLGFYLGRIYGLAAASLVLVVLILETVTLYRRLARSLQSEREERERRLLEMQSELIHISRLGELGQMVSALAHEVNQPLTAITNYIRGGQRLVRVHQEERAEAALVKAASEAERAREIIRRLRDFIRKNDGSRRAEDLNAAITEIVPLALSGAGQSAVRVELRLRPDISASLIDKVQIQQVLLNLIRNAIEAMDGQTHQAIMIATAPSSGDMVEVSVTDSGPGLPDSVRSRLFQPFVTTKSTGMGVGLSICYSIIERHGGRLWAEDTPAGSTAFRFTVPAVVGASQAPSPG